MSGNAFDWEHVRELVDLDGHIDFARDIAARYSWEGDTASRLKHGLDLIRRKQADRCLNISIIGEFNAGKSTMINALIGIDLLVSRVIQGTTVANTILEYAPCPAMEIGYADGRREVVVCRDIGDLRAKIPQYTTDPAICRGMTVLRVGIPSEFLHSGIRIIDTPGINSLDGWHEEMTRQSIHELSDLSIILSPATHVCSSYLLDFVEENLGEIAAQCVLVITKMDLVPPEEREAITSFARAKARETFDTEHPLVLPFSSFALQGIGGGIELRMQSENTLESILEHTGRNRQLAQLKKLTSLSKYMFEALEEAIDSARRDTEQTLKLLRKSRQADLMPFINREKTRLIAAFNAGCEAMRPELDKEISAAVTSTLSTLKNRILKLPVSIPSGVNDFIKSKFIADCTEESKNVTKVSQRYFAEQTRLYEKAMHDFGEALSREFAQLAILDMKPSSDLTTVPKVRDADPANLSEALSSLKGVVARENFAFLGGAGAGAVIGTAILPGIGTAIGAAIGFFSGAATSPNVDKVKKDAANKVDKPLRTYLDLAANEVRESFTANRQNLMDAISDNLNRYVAEYKDFIEGKIREESRRQAALESKLKSMGRDLQMIGYRKKQLQNHLNLYQTQYD